MIQTAMSVPNNASHNPMVSDSGAIERIRTLALAAGGEESRKPVTFPAVVEGFKSKVFDVGKCAS